MNWIPPVSFLWVLAVGAATMVVLDYPSGHGIAVGILSGFAFAKGEEQGRKDLIREIDEQHYSLVPRGTKGRG